MKAIFFAKSLFYTTLGCLVMGACSHNNLGEDKISPTEGKSRHICKMTLVGGVSGFNGSQLNSKAISTTWKNGAKIYIRFYNGSTTIQGEAVYDSASKWTVMYEGNLVACSNQECEVRFFVNETFSNSYLVNISPHTEIYEDLKATYAYHDNGEIVLHALLAPKTGRIRFIGAPGAKIKLIGLTSYTSYTPESNQFTTSAAMLTETVASNGSTPYSYVYFTDSTRSIIIIGEDFAFTRNCTDAVLKTGESGYMTIPSEDSHINWERGLYISLGKDGNSEVQLKMLPVAGYTGELFFMAETETTEQIWDIVTGSASPTNSTLPKVDVSYNDVWTFIYKIGNKPGMRFSLPTLEQWQYAAKGGNKSKGYAYAGSNILEDVAWYAANTTSRQPVKTKAPNELGLYDMCGNVYEWTRTYMNSGYCWCGGCYNSSNIDLLSSYYYPDNSGNYFIGFRLILTCP